jgi:hypothetical protein
MILGASSLMIFLKNTPKNRKNRYFSGIFTKKKIAPYPYGSGTGHVGYDILTRTRGNFDPDS